MTQRLAAVLAADMVGYSRLMQADEAGTIARLRTHRLELIDPAITENRGHIIKTTGDGMLVEFASVADAVICAVKIQTSMQRRNQDVAKDQRIEFRIGLNLGDIIFEDGDIFGDGVNVAARLEQIAGVGQICVSAAVHDQVSGRLELSFQNLGEQHLKNMTRPILAYQIELGSVQSPGQPDEHPQNPTPGTAIKPSIAVLPFDNLSGDPEQEFFVDGLTEDILTELSRRHELFVISRNSTFVYKGQAVNLREVGEKLGAQYLVEGSVRKSGQRLRVTVQLIDTANDAHIWAEKYDRTLDDIFAIQDEVTAAIVATLPGRIEALQQDQLARKKPGNMAAYECLLVAKVLHHRSSREDNAKALGLVNRAIALDSEYAHAHVWRGCILAQGWGYGWCEDKDATFALVQEACERAAQFDDNDADIHRVLAAIDIMHDKFTQSRYHQERALALNPNYDLVVVQMGELYTWTGDAAAGVDWITKAMRLNPHHPLRFWSHLGKAHFTSKNYHAALQAFDHLPSLDAAQHAFASACHGWLDDQRAAEQQLQALEALDPEFSMDQLLATLHYQHDADLQHLCSGLEMAGWPR
ncbi:adenylate/guanylate cyclase domain-containing protein [Parasedimentitalea psychrophila]|uniref:Adenylate/guanylate cyclase domain-containing protein n=1 Tax=Parasedimentitalea psychrophila TaxID=2997337 RepID=A0A9Y2L4W4_9RHOB|nr:adenylate/guanylate cyclase domain-containing protein [Parasedimentitalea psychrophila]WIY27457.1 adenylate/guanylate cyclase domain-containing protein [Parasedimentitalea psychrophila]